MIKKAYDVGVKLALHDFNIPQESSTTKPQEKCPIGLSYEKSVVLKYGSAGHCDKCPIKDRCPVKSKKK